MTELYDKHMGASSREERQRKDVVSHFVLRLAYCRTGGSWQWGTVLRQATRALAPNPGRLVAWPCAAQACPPLQTAGTEGFPARQSAPHFAFAAVPRVLAPIPLCCRAAGARAMLVPASPPPCCWSLCHAGARPAAASVQRTCGAG